MLIIIKWIFVETTLTVLPPIFQMYPILRWLTAIILNVGIILISSISCKFSRLSYWLEIIRIWKVIWIYLLVHDVRLLSLGSLHLVNLFYLGEHVVLIAFDLESAFLLHRQLWILILTTHRPMLQTLTILSTTNWNRRLLFILVKKLIIKISFLHYLFTGIKFDEMVEVWFYLAYSFLYDWSGYLKITKLLFFLLFFYTLPLQSLLMQNLMILIIVQLVLIKYFNVISIEIILIISIVTVIRTHAFLFIIIL